MCKKGHKFVRSSVAVPTEQDLGTTVPKNQKNVLCYHT